MGEIYLDNSATAQPCAAAISAIEDMLKSSWYNPSAPYGAAAQVEKKLGTARETLAKALGVKAANVIFTGGGTEADSLAILGAASRFRGSKRVLLFAGEHPAVLNTEGQLKKMGHEVLRVPACENGIIDLEALEALLNENVGLLSCMQVNNETGAIQPLRALSAKLKAKCPSALLHVDGVQGFLRVPVNLAKDGIDLYSLSGHKIHGVKGTGALVIRDGVKIDARTEGGGQEKGLRSGTENTPGIAAMQAAAEWILRQEEGLKQIREMKLALYRRLKESIEPLRVNGPDPESEEAAPHILNLSFPPVGGEVMLHALEAEGVLVGTGSACSSKKRGMKPAFEAMNAPRWAADSAVRFSFGFHNTMQEALEAAEAVIRCYERYKGFSRR